MKRVIIFTFCFIIAFNIIGNEKIINLRHKKKFPVRKFYLKDEGNNNYGYYQINYFTFDTHDYTVEPYKGKVDLVLAKQLGISYHLFKISIPWAIVSLAVGGLFFGGSTWVLVDSYYNSEQYLKPKSSGNYGESYLKSVRNASISIVVLSSILIVCGFAFVSIFAYNIAKYTKLKKKIINILNGEVVSMFSNKKMKFIFTVDVCL